jgi:hypothetical protein
MDPVENFVASRIALASGAQDCHVIPVLVERASLFPHTAVERDGQVLYDDEDSFFHDRSLLALQQFV